MLILVLEIILEIINIKDFRLFYWFDISGSDNNVAHFLLLIRGSQTGLRAFLFHIHVLGLYNFM